MSRNSARTNKPDPFGQSCLIDFRGSVQGQFRPGSAGVPPLPPQCPQKYFAGDLFTAAAVAVVATSKE